MDILRKMVINYVDQAYEAHKKGEILDFFEPRQIEVVEKAQ